MTNAVRNKAKLIRTAFSEVFKPTIVSCAAVAVLWDEFIGLDQIPLLAIPASMDTIHDLVIRLMIGVLAIIEVIALLDIFVQQVQHTKQMRMVPAGHRR